MGEQGAQISSLSNPHLSKDDIFDAVNEFYEKFYFYPSEIFEIAGEMLRDSSTSATTA